MKKIIHMSDLHIGHKDLGDRFRSVIRTLIFEKGDKPDDYIIVITGDLVDDANDLLRNDEVRSGLDSLRQSGFNHILAVPGNHDYGTGSHGDKKFVRIFKQAFFGGDAEYPKTDIIDAVALIGLDSMAEELHWYDQFFAEGELGKKQLDRLDAALRRSDIRACRKRVIYMHHHPFDAFLCHQLKDSEALNDVLAGVMNQGISVDAMLYGHNHAGKVHHGQWGIQRCCDAGSALRKERPEFVSWMPWFKVRDATRLIKIEEDPLHDYELRLL